jgi:Ni/Co efflux regulator RcnB
MLLVERASGRMLLGLVAITAALLASPVQAGNPKKPSPQQTRSVQQPRPQPARSPQQFRSAPRVGGLQQHGASLPSPNAPRNEGLHIGGGLSTGRSPASHRAFGSGTTLSTGGATTRHFGVTGSGAGIRHFGSPAGQDAAGRSVPHRVTGGRGYVYRGRTFSAFHADPYRWPHGFRYERYAVGYALPRAFWTRDYYIDDYAVYDLDPPPPAFEWVRYGPDILLVDLASGQISQVVYGAFDDTSPDQGAADAPADQ